MPRSRKITIIVLIVLTLVLAGISVYIAIRLNQEDQAPTDTSAAVVGNQGCLNSLVDVCGNGLSAVVDNTCTNLGRLNGVNGHYRCVAVAACTGTNKQPGDTCVQGQSCPEDGGCDGPGPLGCNECFGNVVRNGQYVCTSSTNPNDASYIAACGGALSSCSGTSHCSNGSQDCGETGLDCGGDCSACSGSGGALQCPNGTGTAGGCLVFLCPNGCGSDNRCQGDDVGVQIFAENGSCSATLDGRCGQIDIMQGSNISVSNPGSFCGVKVDAVSGEQITCGLPICNPVVTAQCNQACTGTGQGNCASGLQCLSGVCRLPSNPTSATCQTSTQPTCNQACTGTGQGNCATTDLQCISGVCRNPNVPNDSDCIADPAPTCGGTCGAGGTCPTGNVCNSSNICVLTQCLNNSNCTNNGCTLPSTALFSEGGDNKLLIGVMLIIVGLLATQVKFNTVFENLSTFSDKLGFRFENKVDRNIENKITSVSETKNKRVKKSRKKFEKRF